MALKEIYAVQKATIPINGIESCQKSIDDFRCNLANLNVNVQRCQSFFLTDTTQQNTRTKPHIDTALQRVLFFPV